MGDQETSSASNPERNQTGDPFGTSRMSFGEHLEELRSRIILMLIGVVLGTAISLFFGKEFLEFIYKPLLIVQHANGLQPKLQVLSPTAGFTAYLKIGFLGGAILAMPWVLYQGWLFVASGLFPREQSFVTRLVPASTILFVVGVLFLYYLVLPIILQFFVSFNQAFGTPQLSPSALQILLLPEPDTITEVEGLKINIPILLKDPLDPRPGDLWVNPTTRRLMLQSDDGIWSVAFDRGEAAPTMQSDFALDFYISFVLRLALAFGIAFQTPIVVLFLTWSRLVSMAALERSRRYIFLGMVVAAAVLTPPDVISQLLLAGPMYALFEFGILLAKLKRKKPEEE